MPGLLPGALTGDVTRVVLRPVPVQCVPEAVRFFVGQSPLLRIGAGPGSVSLTAGRGSVLERRGTSWPPWRGKTAFSVEDPQQRRCCNRPLASGRPHAPCRVPG